MSRLWAYFLVGPTAVGKTAVAQQIAEEDGLDIISADSMLVYRGMDIGTAKPTPAERSRVRYWGLDLVAPQAGFSVGAFCTAVGAALRQLAAQSRKALVVGGTGLYVKCLTDGLAALPASVPERRAHWERVHAAEGLAGLQAALRAQNPAAWGALRDPANPRRLIRALELTETGLPAAPQRWKAGVEGPPLVGLRLPPAQLRARIETRVQQMYRGGLLQEAQRLQAEGLAEGATAWQAIGYAEARAHLEGRCSLADAQAQTVRRTLRLAKRQLTWFRHQANVQWIERDQATPVGELAQLVRAAWQRCGPTPLAEF